MIAALPRNYRYADDNCATSNTIPWTFFEDDYDITASTSSNIFISGPYISITIQVPQHSLEDEPWKVPNHYAPAPIKIEFKSVAPKLVHKKLKQPASKSGFKRGQRKIN